MKRITVLLVLAVMLLITSCGYKGYEVIDMTTLISPDGTVYTLIPMASFCCRAFNPSSDEVIATITETDCEETTQDEETIEFELYEVPGSDFNLLTYYDKTVATLRSYTPVFCKEGYDMPSFDSIDKIESIYFLPNWVISEWYHDYSEELLSQYQIKADTESFVSTILGCKLIENDSEFYLDMTRSAEIGRVVYKFDDIENLYFLFPLRKSTEYEQYYLNTPDGWYTIPAESLSPYVTE